MAPKRENPFHHSPSFVHLSRQVILDSLSLQNVMEIYSKLLNVRNNPSSVVSELHQKIELWISFRFKSIKKTKVIECSHHRRLSFL